MRCDLLATVGQGLGESEGEARLGADAGAAGGADVRPSEIQFWETLGLTARATGGDARQPTGHKWEEGLKANVNERLRRAWQTGDSVDGDGDGDVDERQTELKLT